MRSLALIALCCARVLVWTALGQSNPPPTLSFSIQPPDGTILITETTNLVEVSIAGVEQFTNVVVAGNYESVLVSLVDDGNPPDAQAGDGTYSGEIVTPFVLIWSMSTTFEVQVNAEVYVEPTDPPPDPLPDPVFVGATNAVEYVVVARPLNDKFTNAFKIPAEGGVEISTNDYASLESGEPQHAGNPSAAGSVWWTWSPGEAGNVLMDLSGTVFPSVLAVYRGSSISNLSEVASSGTGGISGPGPYVDFDAVGGATYRIAVAGRTTNDMGSLLLRVVPDGDPDTQGPAVTIVEPPGDILVTTNALVVQGTARDPQPHGIGVAAVFVQVNDEAPVVADGIDPWEASVTLPPGTNLVQAYATDVAGNTGPIDSVVVRYINPTNDAWASAIELTELQGVLGAINGRASVEPGEPLHAGNEGGHSIWYWLRAPLNGMLTLSTENSDFDTLLAVYTGDGVTNLTLVAGNDDAGLEVEHSELEVPLEVGEVYSIAIDGYGGENGSIELRYEFVTTDTFYRLDLAPVLGGVVSPGAGLYLEGTQLMLSATASADFEFVEWLGTVSGLENPLAVTLDRDHEITAVFRVLRYVEGFESGEFGPWWLEIQQGSPWRVQGAQVGSGQWAARSGPIADGQESRLVMTMEMLEGTGSFKFRVSSEEGWDSLEFHINGSRLNRWSGEMPWQDYRFAVPEGFNVLEWRYRKDANFSAGDDGAFIDDIYLPLAEFSIAPRLAVVQLPGGEIEIQLSGLPGRLYRIDASADFDEWTTVHSANTPDGTLRWVEPEASAYSRRYYRAVGL